MGAMEDVESFFESYPKISVKPGFTVYSPQDKCSWIYYLKSGLVRQWQVAQNGRMFTINYYRAGSFFPLPNVLSNHLIGQYFDAGFACVFHKAPVADFLVFLKSHPAVTILACSKMCLATEGLISRLENISLGTALNRVSWLLFLLSRGSFSTTSRKKVSIGLSLTHREISSWTGISRETASIQLGWLRKHKIIAYKHQKILIRDLTRLKLHASC